MTLKELLVSHNENTLFLQFTQLSKTVNALAPIQSYLVKVNKKVVRY